MKLRRKLVPAMALLLVSVMMMSTTTYAWFSINKTATAKGMQVQATAAQNLMISTGQIGPWLTEINNVLAATTMIPTAPVDMDKSGTVVAAEPNDGDTIEKDLVFLELDNTSNSVPDPSLAAAKETITTKMANITGFYKKCETRNMENAGYVMGDLYLKYDGAGATNTPTCAVTVSCGEEKAIDKALHVGFLTEDKVFYEADLNSNFSADHYETISLTCPALTKSVAQKITYFAWYDGEDTDCTTNNAAVNNLTIEFAFTAGPVA